MLSVAIIGGTGYTGKYLLQFLNNHSHVSDITIYSHSSAGKQLNEVFPGLKNIVPNTILVHPENLSLNHDVYFSALPHGKSYNYVPMLIENDKTVIDLSGDFRLGNNSLYEEWYGFTHPYPELLSNKTYALADFPGTYYNTSKLISNPGCYPTSVLLALLPILKGYGDNLISVSSCAYSGTSGAGKNPKQHLLMSEMFGNVAAYKVNNHQHTPEIEQYLNKFNKEVPFSFTTHLLPVAVGIYTTTTIHTEIQLNEEELKEYYKEVYSSSPFVRLQETPPLLNEVTGTNFCDINISSKGNIVVITSAIDNLIKGASGQAVQNMNKYFGYAETEGLIKNKSLVMEMV